jgi:long-chain fatty acid transport protein
MTKLIMPKMQLNRLVLLLGFLGALSFNSQAMAAAFQLWEQDAASLGNYHAGRAAEAADASTAYYNPAGIPRIKNQQLILGHVFVLSNIKYRGTVATNTYMGNAAQNITAQGGAFSQIPSLHYVAPISPNLGFGLSVTVPFGLKTDYGRSTVLRYTATSTQLQVIDISPALGFNINKQFSLGAGINIERMSAQFNQVGTQGLGMDTTSTNKGWSTAYGYHLGALYQFTPSSRLGVTYQSQIVHHLRGSSRFEGPLATLASELAGLPAGPIVSPHAYTAITLPAYTTLSAYHEVNPSWAIMGSAIYTQWSVFENLTLKNVAAVMPNSSSLPTPTTAVIVNIPQHYRNTWNFSLGANYHASEKLTLRSGIGYDQSPVKNAYRNVQVPDNNKYAVAIGGHYQASNTLGFDLGWTHLFIFSTTKINPPAQVAGVQSVKTNGKVNANADVLGAQFTWDIV